MKRYPAGVILALGVVALLPAAWVVLPVPVGLLERRPAPSVTVVDRNGLELRTTRAGDGTRERWLTIDEMDPRILQAFIALEDRRFQEHHGVDPRALVRALRDNLRAGRVVSGASTITMQLARLLHPGPRTLASKVSQVLWAVRLDLHLSRQQVLEQYLNRVPLGRAVTGVQAAALIYFETSAGRLSLAQAAMLAGLAREPSRADPFAAPERARARRDLALARMRAEGHVSAHEVELALAEPLLPARVRAPFLAPHFTTQVLGRADGQTGGRAGLSTIRTSIDLPLQSELEGEVRHTVDLLRDHGGRQAAAVVLDNATGEVLAWVGSPDFWSDTAGQVDMVVSRRQPGSALKPFVYGLALDRGLTAASILPDIPKDYQTSTGVYRPRNYDRAFHGPVRLREALASSYNVPAVDVTERIGTGALLQTLHLAGFESLSQNAEHYGIGLALGNGDVTLLELANAYRALANGGVWREWTWNYGNRAWGSGVRMMTVTSRPLILDPEPLSGRRVISAVSAAIILDILSDPVARIPGFGTSTPFNEMPFPFAVKTGTSRNFTDNWAIGVAGGFTVAVWVGNFSGEPMNGISGVTGAGPLLRRAALRVAARYQPGAFTTPQSAGAVAAEVCRHSGLLASPGCTTMREWFVPGSVPALACDWHSGGSLKLPVEYAEWEEKNGARFPGPGVREDGTAQASADTGPGVTARDSTFRITSPRDGDRYEMPPGVESRFATIALRASAVGSVRWWVDGREVKQRRWGLKPGLHTVRAVSGQASDEARIVVE